jgi:Ca-activated chloride channel family protein
MSKTPAILFLLFLLIVPAWSQQTSPENSQLPQANVHEDVEVDLVSISMTATDWKGKFVTNIKPEELTLKEDGVVQQVQRFTNSAIDPDVVPLTVAYLIDTSTSMNESLKGISKLDVAKRAASSVLQEMQPTDQMLLMNFNRDSFMVSELTSDKAQLEAALALVKVKYGRTALYDGIYKALDKIKDQWGRKLMVICTDGQDNASTHSLDELLIENLTAADVTVLAFGAVEFEPAYTWQGMQDEIRRGKEALKRLADSTGGFAYFPKNLEEAAKATDKLREIVRSQYSLAYRSTNPALDGSWRKIEITCTRSGVKLRFRSGYYAK